MEKEKGIFNFFLKKIENLPREILYVFFKISPCLSILNPNLKYIYSLAKTGCIFFFPIWSSFKFCPFQISDRVNHKKHLDFAQPRPSENMPIYFCFYFVWLVVCKISFDLALEVNKINSSILYVFHQCISEMWFEVLEDPNESYFFLYQCKNNIDFCKRNWGWLILNS